MSDNGTDIHTLYERLTSESRWGKEINAYHLHDMALARRAWPAPISPTDVVLFAAVLHHCIHMGYITPGEFVEVLITLNVHPDEIPTLTNEQEVFRMVDLINKRMAAENARRRARAKVGGNTYKSQRKKTNKRS